MFLWFGCFEGDSVMAADFLCYTTVENAPKKIISCIFEDGSCCMHA